MNKVEFIAALEKALEKMPEAERRKATDFYLEAIADRMDDGMSEEEAVAALGSISEAAEQTMVNAPFKALISAGAIVGSPLWLPLVIAFAAVGFSVYISLWAVVLALFAAALAMALAGAAGVVAAIVVVWREPASGVALLGAGLMSMGLAVLLCAPLVYCARGIIKLTAMTGRGIKRYFIRKRG